MTCHHTHIFYKENILVFTIWRCQRLYYHYLLSKPNQTAKTLS